MQNETAFAPAPATSRLVTAPKLLELIWPDEDCRPSLRSIRNWTAGRIFPHVRIGHLVYYDPEAVKSALNKCTIRSKAEPSVGGY